MSLSTPSSTLSEPKLFTSSSIKSNPSLSTSLTHFINSAFHRSRHPPSGAAESKWDTGSRFESLDQLHTMLSDERSVMAVIFDSSSSSSTVAAESSSSSSSSSSGTESRAEGKEKREEEGIIVACAAAVPWAGGWCKEGASTERGWEIKTVCVHGDDKYLRKGLAVKLLGFLDDYLVRQAKAGGEKGKVTLWILAAECINGVYWRKRGYKEVRRRTEGKGVWGCRTEFDMVVFKREVEF